MANQEISLKWNGYQSNILFNVKELFKDECLSDVTLVSEGHSFKAHKVILSANSSVFRTIFQQNPHKDPIIVLHDISTASLRTLLTFMYNGEVNVTEEFLPILLKTAETLRICGLSTGSETSREEDKTPGGTVPKKRKKSEHEDSSSKCKKCVYAQGKQEAASNNLVPKLEPVESPLTDCSGENTNDTDIAVLDDVVEKKQNKSGAQSKKRKRDSDNNNKCKKCVPVDSETVHKISSDSGKQSNIVLKIEPVESLLTEYSGDNTNDMEIALLEDSTEKKLTVENCLNKKVHNVSDRIDKSEVSSTQPCLNEKLNNGDASEEIIEIDKEVETVLQSGTRIESLSIKTENLNVVSTDCKDPSFPCPFCPRVYNSWGYRRRHVKSRHVTNRLSCKWCISVLPSTGAWYTHATRTHGVPHEEARNSLVVMVEAHAVLTQMNEPNVTQLLV
ncbi:protein tramtrack, beta isoform-like [Spodoptera litura]|uniref:Protein tramtrack, beta isoform-like n=1 Tax=Spodoptera litura TaxID=69820 RepID=A0A9J7E3Q5_SPOLT|nr:protein tramtrack, beta isoform-like [Spodoptera litura]